MQKSIIVSITILLYSCVSPFNTKTTDDDIFEVNITHNIERVMPTARVILTWSEVTVENFASFRIERMTPKDTSWTLAVELDNELLTSYVDTIRDDEDLLYRVGIVDVNSDIVWAEGSTNIPRTTSTVVPDEFATIQPAFNSDLIDDGDTILVKNGVYAETLGIAGKDVLIKSINGYKNTILLPTYHESPNETERVVAISSGILNGFTIEEGKPHHAGDGGGIKIAQTGTVINCYISNNLSNGSGGGVFVTDMGKLYNCIVTGDTATVAAGIFLTNAHGEIINNTFAYNSLKGDEVVFDGPNSGLIFRNNIVINPASDQNISFIDPEDSTGIIFDYLLLDSPIEFGKNIIVDDPMFIDNVEYRLLPNSPGVDSGHPDEQYNDNDGTRNDIGAYGGPYNEK